MGNSTTMVDTPNGVTLNFMECIQRLLGKKIKIHLFASMEGCEQLFHRNDLKPIKYLVECSSKYRKVGMHALYLVRMIKLCLNVIKLEHANRVVVIHSGSDFWPFCHSSIDHDGQLWY